MEPAALPIRSKEPEWFLFPTSTLYLIALVVNCGGVLICIPHTISIPIQTMAAIPPVATNNKQFVIELAFQQHTAGAYRSIHHKLNAQYGGIIHDIDDLFTADRAALPTLITAKVIEHMSLPNNADVARFNQMCNSGALTLRWLTYNPETYSRLNKLTYVVDDAAIANTNILRIRININGLHFKDDFKAHNFNEISMDPFPDAPLTPQGGTQNNQAPATPVTINALERIIAAISPAARG